MHRPASATGEHIICSPQVWHFNFRGPDEERLVAGRERIYLDRFWNELSADPRAMMNRHGILHLLYARPHAIHDAFNQFGAFSQDAIDNKALLTKGKLTMPVLAIGAEKSFGTTMADDIRFVVRTFQMGVVPHSGHWVMEENPNATMASSWTSSQSEMRGCARGTSNRQPRCFLP